MGSRGHLAHKHAIHEQTNKNPFGKPNRGKMRLRARMRRRRVRRRLRSEEGEGREALTYWEVLERFDGLAHLSLSPKTGRTHQLRAHLASIELPILEDAVYRGRGGHSSRLPDEAPLMKRHALLASELCFPHPKTGVDVRAQASAAVLLVL